jgi:hypothetical protein
VAGVDLVELECDACIDMPGVLRMMAESGEKLPQGQADALITGLRIAMQAAHATPDPRTGGGICLGRLTYANVLLGRSGRVWLLGFGSNYVLEGAALGTEPPPTCFQAPEVAAGGRANPTGDYVALLHLMRSVVHFVELAPVLQRLLRGEESALERRVFSVIRWFNDRVMGTPVARRAPIDVAARQTSMMRRLVGVEADFDGLRQWLVTHLADYEAPRVTDTAAPCDLEVGPAAEWFVLRGAERLFLAPRPTMRRLLHALLTRRLESPGTPVTVWELVDAMWPDETVDPLAAPNRVYVAVNRLRSLGLRDVIEHVGDGYRLSPACSVRVDPL